MIYSYIAIILIVFSATRFKLCFIHLILFALIRILHTTIFFKDALSIGVAEVFSISTSLFCIGLVVGSKKHNSCIIRQGVSGRSTDGLTFAIFIVVLLTTYHYFKIGVPFLSENLETARFSLTGSGILGIPSRVATYGPIVIIILTLVHLAAGKISYYKIIIYFFISGILLILQGHKSSPWMLFIGLVIVNRLLGKKANKLWIAMLLIGLPLMVYFVYFTFNKMTSLSNFDFVSYLVARFSVIGILPIDYIISETYTFDLIVPSMSIHDLIYPFAALVGIQIETVNTQLSHLIYRIPDGKFTVPVTPTFIGYFNAEFGLYGGFAAMLFLGYLCSLWYRRVGAKTTIKSIGLSLYIEFLLYVGLTSGNIFYLLPNAILVWIFFDLLMISFTYYARTVFYEQSF